MSPAGIALHGHDQQYVINILHTAGLQARNAIQQAIDEYKLRSCVEFVPRNPQTDVDYVRFFRGGG